MLRRELHARGLRFRIQLAVPDKPRRTVDLAFTRPKLAVLVDGCFWHGCPIHGSIPATNTAWWEAKIAGNQERDTDTDHRLREAGWTVARVWEHTPPIEAADRVEAMYRELLRKLDH